MRAAELIAGDDERSRCGHGRTGGAVAPSTLAPCHHAGVGTVVAAVNKKVVDRTGYGDVAPVRRVACARHWFTC